MPDNLTQNHFVSEDIGTYIPGLQNIASSAQWSESYTAYSLKSTAWDEGCLPFASLSPQDTYQLSL